MCLCPLVAVKDRNAALAAAYDRHMLPHTGGIKMDSWNHGTGLNLRFSVP